MNLRDLKIAIYGAGAMGTVLGAFLTKGGLENVHLITRNQAHVDSLNKRGAVVECVADGKTLLIPVKALTPAQMQGQYDIIFLMTKQRHNAETLQFLLPYLKADGVLCTTQNGLPEESVLQAVGRDRTYGCVASYGAELVDAGKVKLTSKMCAMSMQVGGYQNDGKYTALLEEILSYAGNVADNDTFVCATDNLAGARWSKLAINAAFSGLSVMTGLSFGEIAKKRKTKRIALGVLRECMDVAAALNVQLESMQGHDMQKMLGGRGFFKTQLALLILPFAMKKHKKLKSGMLKDMLAGLRCEIDFINGVVCKAGRQVCVETPLCDKIVEIVHGIENGLYELTPKNVDFF